MLNKVIDDNYRFMPIKSANLLKSNLESDT